MTQESLNLLLLISLVILLLLNLLGLFLILRLRKKLKKHQEENKEEHLVLHKNQKLLKEVLQAMQIGMTKTSTKLSSLENLLKIILSQVKMKTLPQENLERNLTIAQEEIKKLKDQNNETLQQMKKLLNQQKEQQRLKEVEQTLSSRQNKSQANQNPYVTI